MKPTAHAKQVKCTKYLKLVQKYQLVYITLY